jgi:hypothetical protein
MLTLAEALHCFQNFFPRELPDPVFQRLQTISAAAGAVLIARWLVQRLRTPRLNGFPSPR